MPGCRLALPDRRREKADKHAACFPDFHFEGTGISARTNRYDFILAAIAGHSGLQRHETFIMQV